MQKSVYLVIGPDSFQVLEKAREIVETLVPEADRAFGLETVDGDAENGEAAEQAIVRVLEGLRTAPFLGGRKTVWLKEATFLAPGAAAARSEAVKARIGQLAEEIRNGLGPAHVLIISAPSLDGRSALYKACKNAGELHTLAKSGKSREREAQGKADLGALLKASNLKMSAAAREAFMERVGGDYGAMRNELEKLALYTGGSRPITRDDVETVVSASREALRWDLSDAFGDRDLSRSLRIFRRLIFQKESPVGLIYLLEGRLRELLLIREAIDREWLTVRKHAPGSQAVHWNLPDEADRAFAGEMSKDPRKTHWFRTKILAEQALRFTPTELKRSLNTVHTAHRKLMSSSIPPDLLLELCLIACLGQRQKNPRSREPEP